MQIGLNAIGGSLERIVGSARQAEAEGFASMSVANIFSHDAIGALTLAGAQTERIELVTAVVPIYMRHPLAMAQQAMTAQAASDGRFVLGIGLSHQRVIEGTLGISFERPAARMREYLQVLMPLLHGEAVEFEGEWYTLRGQLRARDAQPTPCVIAAMAPVMLRLAGEVADGTILWMAGAKAIRDFVAPRVVRAASNAGRPDPRIVASLPVALSSDVAKARQAAGEQFANYNTLPSYRSMLDHQGAEGPADAALVGDEAALDAALRELEEAGVTQFNALIFDDGDGSVDRTREYLASKAASKAG